MIDMADYDKAEIRYGFTIVDLDEDKAGKEWEFDEAEQWLASLDIPLTDLWDI